jgi:hypothetical protein
MRRLTIGTFIAGIVGALAILGFLLSSGPTPSSHAQVLPPDISTVYIHLNAAGDTVSATCQTGTAADYPCNNFTTLAGGSAPCASIPVGGTVVLDIVGQSIPLGAADTPATQFLSGMGADGFDGALDWSPNGLGVSPIAVTAKDTSIDLVSHALFGSNISSSSPDPVGLNASGEGGHWRFAETDINTEGVGEGGMGIGVRLTITGVLAGTASLSLGAYTLADTTWFDVNGNVYTVGSFGGATIVVGAACPIGPTATPAPTATPSPTPAPTATPSPTPIPTPSPTPPFNPTYTINIDQNDAPNEFIILPEENSCLTNTLAFPLGIPCEMFEQTVDPAGNDYGIELYTIIPAGPTGFTIASGHPALGGVPDGSTIGNFGFDLSLQIPPGSGACAQSIVNLGYPAITLVNAALPGYTSGPWAGASNGMPPQGPDGTNLFSTTSFPTQLEYDSVAAANHTAGAALWARYFGVAPVGTTDGVSGTTVNILVWNQGTSYLTETILGDPTVPLTSTTFAPYCSLYTTSVDYLGADPTSTCPDNTNLGCTTVNYMLRQCNAPGPKTVTAAFLDTRTLFLVGPTAATVYRTSTTSCHLGAITMTKDESLGDNNPAGDIVTSGAPSSHDIALVVPGPTTLTLSIMSLASSPGSAACMPTFSNPLDTHTSIINGQFVSTATIAGANGPVIVSYTINCPVPGDYCFQIVANAAASPGNGNIASQVENQVCVHVVLGTNVSVTVQKEENYNVVTSQDTTKAVTITVTNTGVTADVLVHITAISAIPGCQVRVVADPANPYPQTYNEYYTTENPANLPNPDTFTSQITFTIPAMAGNSSQTFQYSYTIHCFERSYHTNAFELQVDALPLANPVTPGVPPVYEQNLGIPQFPCGNNGHGPNDNVDKNCPNVTSYDLTDIQKSGCTLTATPSTNFNVGQNFQITNVCTITDLGPTGTSATDPVNYLDTSTLTIPSDCQIVTGANPQPSSGPVWVGTPQNDGFVWTVNCANPSDHVFVANDSLVVTTLHVTDTNLANNTGTATTTIPILWTANLAKSGCTLTLSAGPYAAGTPFTLTSSCVVTNNGPATTGFTDTTTLTLPPDCTTSDPNPNVYVGPTLASGQNSFVPETGDPTVIAWTVTCANGSDHNFVANDTVAVTTAHVSDPDLTNNQSTASTTPAILAACNVTASVSGTAVSDITGSTANLSTVVTVNGGPAQCHVTWTVVVTGDATGGGGVPCTVTQPSPNTGSATVPPAAGGLYVFTATIPAGDIHECGYTVTVTATADGVHQSGTATSTFHGVVESNVIVAKYCIAVGPAAVNLSDTNGRYEFDICEIGNVTADPETVTIGMTVTADVPAGCTRTQGLILPGATTFTLGANEQKVIVYRVRYECHAPVVAQVINQTVTFTVTHIQDVPGSPGDVETFTSDNTKTVTKQVIIQ